MFHFNELSEKLKNTVKSFAQGADKEDPEFVMREVNIVFDRAIKRIKDEIEEPSLDISRYTTIAGKNNEVLQKLISNSVHTLEVYKEEFNAAANDKDAEALSNLIHKNTTSLHYLQTNRLRDKINEFRNSIKTSGVREEDPGKKQKEVMEEFEWVINVLSNLKE